MTGPYFEGFDWDEGNAEKCRAHGVSIEEIESALISKTRVIVHDVKHSEDERRHVAIGRTVKGRDLFVGFTFRIVAGRNYYARLQRDTCTGKRLNVMSKRVPQFKTDEEVEKFLEQDLSDYLDPKYMVPLPFEYRPKDAQVNLRLAKELLQAIKARAAAEGISYQKFIRMTLEQTVSRSSKERSDSEGGVEK